MGLNNLTGGAFQDMTGSPLQNGYLDCELSHDEQETSTSPHGQVVGGLHRRIFLDNNGNAVTGSALWANDVMSPASSYYIVKAYRSDGTLAWKAPQYWTITSAPSPLDLGTLVPTNPPGGGLGSFSSITLQTNEVNNGSQTLLDLHAGTNMTLTDNGSGQITLAASGGSTFSTAGQGYFLGAQSFAPISDDSGHTAAATNSANQVFGCQLILESSWTVRKVSAMVVTGNGASQNFTAAIYNAAGTTKLIDAGASAFDTTASQKYREVTLGSPVSIGPGVYLFACGANGTTGGSVLCHQMETWFTDMVNGVSSGTPTYTVLFTAANSLSAGAMPATLGALTAIQHGSAINLPAVLFRV